MQKVSILFVFDMLCINCLANMGSITCKCNPLQLQLLYNFMITDYKYNYFFSTCN